MKPAQFNYVRPESLSEACELLAADEGARLLAGGQTLIPMLSMRLAQPSQLVDIYRLKELQGIRAEKDSITIGAAVRQVEAERSEDVRNLLPLLGKALPFVGHPPTRNRGTVGGSIANADPSAEIPLVAVTLGAEIEITSPGGTRSLPVNDFFIGPMLTRAGPGDCVSAVRFKVWRHEKVGCGFREVSARKSDFALAAAAAQIALDEDGRCLDVALGIAGPGARALRIDVSPLIGTRPDKLSVSDIVRGAAQDLKATADLHATAAYRKRAAAALAVQALNEALADANKGRPQ